MAEHIGSIDTRALEMATRALSEVRAVTREVRDHKDDIRGTHAEIRAGQARIHDRIDDLATRWFIVAGGTILVLLSASGFLLVRLLTLLA